MEVALTQPLVPVAVSAAVLIVAILVGRAGVPDRARAIAAGLAAAAWVALFVKYLAPGMVRDLLVPRDAMPVLYYLAAVALPLLVVGWYLFWKAMAPTLAYGLIILIGAVLCVPYLFLATVDWSQVPSSAASGGGIALIIMAMAPLPFMIANLFCGMTAFLAPIERSTLYRLKSRLAASGAS